MKGAAADGIVRTMPVRRKQRGDTSAKYNPLENCFMIPQIPQSLPERAQSETEPKQVERREMLSLTAEKKLEQRQQNQLELTSKPCCWQCVSM